MIYKVEAEGDTLYIEAESKGKAEEKLKEVMGDIPSELLTWTEGVELPEGEGLL